MLANYYRTAIRHLARSRLHTIINVIGLSAGIAFTLLIAAYCYSELRVNRELRHADRQYILSSDWKDPNMGYPLATLGPLARALKENYPGLVANYYRFDGVWAVVSVGNRPFREGLQLGDSTLLTMYGFPLVHGDPHTALSGPSDAVITEEKARKLFGTTDVVGRSLNIDNFSGEKRAFRITGVMKEPARNSVTRLSASNENGIFVGLPALAWFGRNMDWSNPHIAGYIELQPGVRPEALQEPIEHLIKGNADPIVAANLRAVLQRLPAYYLSSDGGAVQKMLYTLSFIAVFILGMAVINFINLSVSRSTLRLKEIGIRRVLGGLRRQVRMLFLAESVLLALASTFVALAAYPLLSPLFSAILGREMPALWTLPLAAWALILLLALLTGVLAGLYPAIQLSSLPAVDSLKGRLATVKENRVLRKGLIGLQFGTAMIVFAGALIVSQQIRLFFGDKLGYNKEYIVNSQLPRDWSRQGVQHMMGIRDIFARMPDVKDVTLSFEVPDGMNSGSLPVFRQDDTVRSVVAQALVTDAHYAATYQIPLAAGVFFHGAGESSVRDSMRVVLNETAAKALGWKDAASAVGQRLHLYGAANPPVTVSGVVRDFHFDGMGSAIQPELFGSVEGMGTYRYLSFKLRPGNIGATLAALQKQWSALMP